MVGLFLVPVLHFTNKEGKAYTLFTFVIFSGSIPFSLLYPQTFEKDNIPPNHHRFTGTVSEFQANPGVPQIWAESLSRARYQNLFHSTNSPCSVRGKRSCGATAVRLLPPVCPVRTSIHSELRVRVSAPLSGLESHIGG